MRRRFKCTPFVFNDIGGFSWTGKVKNEKESMVTFVVREGIVAASVITLASRYTVSYAGDGLHLIEEFDPDFSPGDCDTVLFSRADISVTQFEGRPYKNSEKKTRYVEVDKDHGVFHKVSGSCEIDLLVFYTEDAEGDAGGTTSISTRIQEAVAAANDAFANSNLTTRLKLRATLLVDYNESGNFITDLERLTQKTDNHLDVVHNFRDDYGADLVTLVVGNKSGYGTGCGRANRMCNVDPSEEKYGFNVVKEECLSYLTLAHEVAHNLGCNHAPGDDLGKPCISFNHSYGYKNTSVPFRTIMALKPGGPIIPYFSSSVDPYMGGPLGTSTQDNALTIAKTCDIVADYRSPKKCVTQIALLGDSGGASTQNGGQSRDLFTTLYRFRDEVLAKTPKGQEFIRLFYKNTVEASWLLIKNPLMREETKDVLGKIIPLLNEAANGRSTTLSPNDFEVLENILDYFAANGSDTMRKSINTVLADYRKENILSQFGIHLNQDTGKETVKNTKSIVSDKPLTKLILKKSSPLIHKSRSALQP